MAMRQRGKPKLRHPVKRVGGSSGPSIDEIIREARQKKSADGDYRERALRIHGLICAKCGREFDHTNRQLLTVHHRDGNHNYNMLANLALLHGHCHDEVHRTKCS